MSKIKQITNQSIDTADKIKGELHSNSWNLTFVDKLQFPLILKHQKIDNRSGDIYVFSHTEKWFYTFSE